MSTYRDGLAAWMESKMPITAVEHLCVEDLSEREAAMIWGRCKSENPTNDMWVEHRCNEITAVFAYAMAMVVVNVSESSERTTALDGLTSALRYACRGIEKEQSCDPLGLADPIDE